MKKKIPRLSGAAKAVARGELIFLPVEVVQASDAGLVGLQGTVVDETLHTLTVRVGDPGGRRVQVPKAGCTFRLTLPEGGTVDVEGRAIAFRSEDRTKKVR